MGNVATAPTAAPQARERRAYYVAATLDGYVKILARNRAEAREAFDRMDKSAIAASLELWAEDDPKLLEELPDRERKNLET
jgi:hypothetical protein